MFYHLETLSTGHSLYKLLFYCDSTPSLRLMLLKQMKNCWNFVSSLKHYGNEYCTPNMHLHAHIKDCILDFGPISAFWAFPLERFNGILESFSKNWVKPEDQIMKKFISF